MKIRVNQDACIGCGACCAIAEDLFEINDDGLSQVKVPKVKDEQMEVCSDAMESCPTGAIEEVKDEGNDKDKVTDNKNKGNDKDKVTDKNTDK